MLILFETAAGFALFKISDEDKFKEIDDIYTYMQNEDQANSM